ncbi:dienelactone hydrolase family protein [Thermodesulfobacteriota bacterium]
MKALIKNIYTWLILGALFCIILLGVAAVNRNEDERDKRTEDGEHSFLTFTPSTISQIYLDDWRIRPRKISGELNLPPGDGPFPAVILYHGHYHPDDLKPWFNELVPRLLEANIATFVLDSFSGRKIADTALFEARLSRAARLTDVFQSLNMLAKIEEIDENRIGITGYSVGGTAAMLAADLRLNQTSLARGRSFAAILPVYPSCQVRFRNHKLTNTRIFLLLAENDDYSPSELCEEYAQEVSAEGYDIKIKKYDNTQHGWINDKASTDCEDCMTFKDCGLMYIEDNGHESALDGRVTTLFGWQEYIETLYRDCGTIGVIFRSNRGAQQETLETTVRFFSEILKQAE